ncbi:hypothetical protein [Luteimonas sp. e5]
MTPAEHLAALGLLYGPNAEAMRRELADISDCLHGQLQELHARPTGDKCDRMLIALEGLRRYVCRFRERLIDEGRHE